MFSTRQIAALLLLAATGLTACADPYEEPLPRRDRLNYPVGLALHPAGRYLYVVNSNFDTRYREDLGGTLSVVDLETLRIRERSGPFIPSFGGFVRLSTDGARAYVTARHSDTVLGFDVAPDGSSVFCDDDGVSTSDPSACAIRRVPDASGAARVPADPFALDVTTIPWTDADGESFDIDLLNMGHLRGDNVTAITIPRTGDGPAVASTMKSASLVPGASAIMRRPGTRDIYVGGRVSREVAVYFPYMAPEDGGVEAIVRRASISLGNIGQTVDTRGLAFSEDGDTLYVVTRAPDALHIVDLGPSDPDTATGTNYKVTATLPLARNPSGVHVHVGVGGAPLLYVPSFEEEVIEVIDPTTLTMVDRIELGAQPYDFVVDTGPDRCVPGGRCRAYVTLFNDVPNAAGRCQEDRTQRCGSVGILDLDPSSARYHSLIGKIQ